MKNWKIISLFVITDMEGLTQDQMDQKKELLKQAMAKRQAEKQANEECIAKMQANKEKRRKEMLELEQQKAQEIAEEEEEERKMGDLGIKIKQLEQPDPTYNKYKLKEQVTVSDFQVGQENNGKQWKSHYDSKSKHQKNCDNLEIKFSIFL